MMSQQSADRRVFLSVGVLAGGLPLLITLLSFLGVSATPNSDAPPLNDWLLPVQMMSVLGISIITLFGIIALFLSLRERRAISGVIQNHWVSWPQYKTLEEWHAFVEQEAAEMRRGSGISWSGVIVATILFGFVSGFVVYLFRTERSLAQTSPLMLLVPVGGMYVVVMMISLVLPLLGRQGVERLYRRRIEHPIPCVYIAPQGMYHEDQGYTAFRSLNSGLTEVRFAPDQSALVLSLWYRARSRVHKRVVQVRVPAGWEGEAQDVVQRLKSEVIR